MAGITENYQGNNRSGYGMLWDVAKKELSSTGLGGKIDNVLDSITMMSSAPMPLSVATDIAERNPPSAAGISPAVNPAPQIVTAQKAEAQPSGAGIGAPLVSAPQKPTSMYDNLRKMSDRDFVNFMSREENKNIPGLGWIGDASMKFDKSGKSLDPNFKRLVEDPATRKPEKITVDELEARGKYLQGLGMYEHGIGAREQAAATKTATQEYKTMELQRKASADMQGLIEKFGKTVEGTVDPSIALYRMGKAGIPLPESLSAEDSKRFRAAMDEQTKPLRDTLTEAAAKKGSPLTSGEIFTITNIFEKSRGFSI